MGMFWGKHASYSSSGAGGSKSFRTAALVLSLGVTAVLFGCAVEPNYSQTPVTPPPAPVAEPVIEEPAGEPATFVSVTDGDTIVTSEGIVRIIGIDSPELGECGYDEASSSIGRLLAHGDPVTLDLPQGQNDRDAHDRLLRYVITEAGTDIGLMQIEAGNAVARYDSTDGYPAHPNEASYHAAQTASLTSDGTVLTATCEEAAAAPVPLLDPAPVPAPAPAPSERPWWEQYSSCSKLKKNAVGHPKGPFNRDDPAEAEIYNWFEYGTGHHGDGDGDGWACE